MTADATRRVLIVDDDENSRDVYRTLLEARGYEVLLAEDGGAGRRLLRDGAPELVLLDRKLPDMDGLELLPEIDADVPVICVSARAFDEDREEALSAGAQRYLSKPVSPQKVLGEVESLLGAPGE